MARNDPHFRLRIPAELKTEIERRAAHNKRSINAEIVSLLEEALHGSRFDDPMPEEGTVQHFLWQEIMDQKHKAEELREELRALEKRINKST